MVVSIRKRLKSLQVSCLVGLFLVAVLFQVRFSLRQVDLELDLEQPNNQHKDKNKNVPFKTPPKANPQNASMVHCVGENFLPKTATGFRSCQFRHLCYDTSRHDFVLFESQQHWMLSQLLQQVPSRYAQTSSNFHVTVSLAATTEGLLRQGQGWFPRVVAASPDNYKYQQLEEDLVLVPVLFPHQDTTTFKDIIMDLFLPVYNLLAMFHLLDKRLVLVNLQNCTTTTTNTCFQKTRQLLPLMKQHHFNEKIFNINSSTTSTTTNTIVCAKFGAAGMGALTDHGIHKKSHGQHKKDYVFVHNNGRGPLLLDFRNYLLRNLGWLSSHNDDRQESSLPLQITLMISQSDMPGALNATINAIQSASSPHQLQVHRQEGANMSLFKQIQSALRTHIHITKMGPEAWPALFLPPGATLILFYDQDQDQDQPRWVNGPPNKKRPSEPAFPVRLDWDLWNNLSFLRVHWLPLVFPSTTAASPTEDQHELVLQIIQEEMRRLLPQAPDTTSQQSTTKAAESDGTFNGMEVRLVNNTLSSTVHCVGDNFQEGAHVYRSCHFQYMCFNMDNHNFSLHLPPLSSPKLQQRHHHNSNNKNSSFPLISTASTKMAMSVGRTIRFSGDMSWSPHVSREPQNVFYELMHDAVWIPFYAEQPNIHNPGHLLWDYFLPFYNLLAMFGLQHLPMVPINLDAGCTPDEQDSPCWKLVTKFLPLMGVDPSTFTNIHHSTMTTTHGRPRQSNLVCSRHAVAGIGMLTDHGWNRHGQRMEDYRDVHNVGRGPLFFAFRNHVLGNLGIVEQQPLKPPYKVVFSALSSKNPMRRLSFQNQMDALRGAFSERELILENRVFSKMSLKEQIQLATQTSVFVSVVGGSASVATFLPRGSSVILFFNDVNEFTDHSARKDFPSMIDWDFWNNAAHLRVHWLPMKSMNETVNHNALIELVRSELSTIQEMQYPAQ